MIFNPYEVLGVHPAMTDDEIRDAYRPLVRVNHPDRPGGDLDLFRRVTEAYAQIKTLDLRRNHSRVLLGVGLPCVPCDTRGYITRQISFTAHNTRVCAECGGAGFKERPPK